MKIAIEADWNGRGLETTLAVQNMDLGVATVTLIESAKNLIEEADIELNDDILKSFKSLDLAIWKQLRERAKGSD